MESEGRQTEAFASLTESLVTDFDLAEILSRIAEYCVALCSAEGAGMVVLDADGALRDVAYSSENVRLLESYQTSHGQGPCVDCVRTGRAIPATDLSGSASRWPLFTPAAVGAGFTFVRALPLRAGDRVIGALNLFDAGATPVTDSHRAQTFADLAVIALVQHSPADTPLRTKDAVAHALRTRSTIERAKGILTESGGVPMDEADRLLRARARRGTDGNLTVLAERLVSREISARQFLEADLPPV